MKKAIVTGSNGFIGSNVCKRLCADGIKVFAVVKDENENIDNIKNLSGIEIVYCELDEIETLADIISDRDRYLKRLLSRMISACHRARWM